MPETKTKKKSKNISEEKVRCSPELMTALRKEAAKYNGVGAIAPSQGDMLLTAWRMFDEARKRGELGASGQG